jgi:amphi-Trp domain-containing protein
MSGEKLMQLEQDTVAYMAGMTLKDLAEAFSKRQFCIKDTGEAISIPKNVHLECELKRKDSGKVKLEIEISWNTSEDGQ